MRSVAILATALALTVAAPSAQGTQRPVDPLTAEISGRVTAADTGAPLPRAEVRALSQHGINRLTTTNADGLFTVANLPAGTYHLAASKSGFVTLMSGQRRPFEATSTIDLAVGQRAGMNMALPRAGAIAGLVYDDAGEPVAGATVQALRARTIEGRRQLRPAGVQDVTDDRGAYRVYGLPPGDYYVTARPPVLTPTAFMSQAEGMRVAGPDVIANALIFYPGTSIPDEALRVAVGVSGEARADVRVGDIRTARVSGVVTSATGRSPAGAQVTLVSWGASVGRASPVGPAPGIAPPIFSARAELDGRFELPQVPPGAYLLQARLGGQGGPFDSETTVQQLVVSGDADNLVLITAPGATLEGSFVADAGVTRPLPEQLGVTVRSAGGLSMTNRAGGRDFRVYAMNEPLRVEIAGLSDDWAVRAITVDGADVTDRELTLPSGHTATVRIVLTDRVTEVSGVVRATAGADAGTRIQAPVIVLFAQDPSRWIWPTRHVRTVRADDLGYFTLRGLPGNERYYAAAVASLEEGEASDPEFLQRLQRSAASFLLADAEQLVVEVPLVIP